MKHSANVVLVWDDAQVTLVDGDLFDWWYDWWDNEEDSHVGNGVLRMFCVL